MINSPKTQAEILAKLGIAALNPMQIEAEKTLQKAGDVVLLSPTGTGKTLAFLLPLIASLNPEIEDVQLLIIVPSRELALQIEQVIRELGSGFKANVVYGGRSFSQDKIDAFEKETGLDMHVSGMPYHNTYTCQITIAAPRRAAPGEPGSV